MLDYWNEYPKIQENLIQVKKLISQRLLLIINRLKRPSQNFLLQEEK